MDDNKISQDSILILDESGDFKILNGEKILPYQDSSVKATEQTVITSQAKPSTVNLSSNLPIDTGMEEKMFAPLPPTVRKATASFYFHPSDEEEVNALSQKMDMPAGKKYSLAKIVSKIIDNYHLNLNEELKRKFEQIILSFLRDRRTALEALSLFKNKEFSLAGLPENTADSLMDFLKEIKIKIQAAKGLVVNEEGAEKIGLPEELTLIKQSPEPKPIPKFSYAVTDSQPTVVEQEKEIERLKEITKQAQAEIKPEPVKTIPQVANKPNNFIPSGFRFTRPQKLPANQMTDVKKGYKLFGPVEELAGLTLENFRRFANTPKERAGKVLGRLNLLGKDSLVKKSAGLKAWRQSPIYKMYLAIGQASMEHNLEVKQVIAEYQKEGKEILSMEEFEAITDLNRQLRF